jgi:hypothetical protein
MPNPRFFQGLFVLSLATAQAQNAPTAENAKQAIEQKLQKIWKISGTKGERTVVFQSVQVGRAAAGSYPFRATLAIHDYDSGYPANRYYGQTCVGRIEEETYVLSVDEFGKWQAEGRMTPNLPEKTCKPNTAAGVASIPVSSLQGTRASATVALSVVPATQPAAATAGSGVPVGSYQCWANGQARPLLNFTILNGSQYRDSQGATGAFQSGASSRITWRGGNLDGFLPAGFYTVYYAPQGRPTVSFRSTSGAEVTFCQKQ